MKWRVGVKGDRCGSGRGCAPIVAGQPIRIVSSGLRCRPCAFKLFQEHPPTDLANVPVPQPTLPIEGAHVSKGQGYVSVRRGRRGAPGFAPANQATEQLLADFKRRAGGGQE